MEYSSVTIERFRAAIRGAQIRTCAREQTRLLAARVRARELASNLARDFGVSRVVLIGSTLTPGRFNERSDIDLVVYGLPPDDYFRAVGSCMNPDFDVDLIPYERAHALVLEALPRGEVLYEK